MRITRRLEVICQSLSLPTEQGNVVDFLVNVKNAQAINSLAEDIHEVLMDYQVCMSNCSFHTRSDLFTRFHYNKISTMRAVNSL